MKEPLNILHLEDDALDAALAKTHLCAEGVPCNITHTHERGEFNAALAQENWDVILSDFSMPRFDGLSALEIARARRPEVPFIFVSGTIGEEQAVRALKEGATDYVLKDRMSRLSEAVRRAVKEAHELVQRRDAEDRLRKSEERFQHLLAHSPAVIYSLKVEGGNIFPIFVSENITRLLGFTVEECLTSDWWGRLHAEDSERAATMLANLLVHGTSASVYRVRHKDGSCRWMQDDARVVRTGEGAVELVGAWTDVTERKRAQMELVLASRLAGKAEVATGILHDVRNVLTSVNVSLELLHQATTKSRVSGLQKVAKLLGEQHDLGAFFTRDVKGLKLPVYLRELAACVLDEQQAVITEIGCLRKKMEHILQIVSVQQSHAKVSGAREPVAIQDLIEESLRLAGGEGAMEQPGLRITREFSPVPPLILDKHKLMQVMVNLIRNAKDAGEESGQAEKIIGLKITQDGDWIRISVVDNGIGISAENLNRIFEHGFTTKEDGHGFGLHNAARVVREMGGSLKVESDGLHRGTTFILELPASTENDGMTESSEAFTLPALGGRKED